MLSLGAWIVEYVRICTRVASFLVVGALYKWLQSLVLGYFHFQEITCSSYFCVHLFVDFIYAPFFLLWVKMECYACKLSTTCRPSVRCLLTFSNIYLRRIPAFWVFQVAGNICACSFDCIILIGSFLKGFLFFNVVTCSCGVWDCGSCWESCEYQVLFQIFWQFGCVVWITKYYRLGTFLVIGSGGYFEWWTGLEKWHAGQAS